MSELVCCEGGPMTAGCHHDRCTGPINKPASRQQILDDVYDLLEEDIQRMIKYGET